MNLFLHIKITQRSLLIIGIFMLLTIGRYISYGRDDWQSWNDISIKYRISEKTGFLWSPQIKIGEDISDLFSWRLRQGVFFDYNENFVLGLNYLYKDEKNASGVWRDEHRLEAHATIKWKFHSLKFSDSNKYEYRMRGNRQSSRYRNSLLISKPISLHGVDLTPFIKDEIFYDFDASQFNQNRFSFGASCKLRKHTRLELYYTLKSSRNGRDWNETNIIGTKLKLDY